MGLDEHGRRAARTYAAAADHYACAALGFWDRFGAATVSRLRLAPGQTVLDLCCGAGASALPAARAVGPTGSVVGIDVAAPLLDAARARAEREGLRNVEFRLADARFTRLRDDSFDAVVCVFGVFFVPDMAAFVAEIWAPGYGTRSLKRPLVSRGSSGRTTSGTSCSAPATARPSRALHRPSGRRCTTASSRLSDREGSWRCGPMSSAARPGCRRVHPCLTTVRRDERSRRGVAARRARRRARAHRRRGRARLLRRRDQRRGGRRQDPTRPRGAGSCRARRRHEPVGAGDDVRPNDPARRLRRFAARRCARGRAARLAARERAGAARSCPRTSGRARRRRRATSGPGLGDPGVAPGDQRGRLRGRNGPCRRAVSRRDRVALEGRPRVPPIARPAQRRSGPNTGRDGARWPAGGEGDSLGGGPQPGQSSVRARARAQRRRHGLPEALARSLAAVGVAVGWRVAGGARRAADVRTHGRPASATRAARARRTAAAARDRRVDLQRRAQRSRVARADRDRLGPRRARDPARTSALRRRPPRAAAHAPRPRAAVAAGDGAPAPRAARIRRRAARGPAPPRRRRADTAAAARQRGTRGEPRRRPRAGRPTRRARAQRATPTPRRRSPWPARIPCVSASSRPKRSSPR